MGNIPIDLLLIVLIPLIVGVSFWLAKRSAGIVGSPEISFENIVLSIRVPKENEKEALAAEQMFSSLHGLLRLTPGIQEHISFEIAGSATGINFYAVCPRALRNFVESQVYAQYPAAEIRESTDYAGKFTDIAGRSIEGATLTLAKPQYFPIRTFREFEVDPLAAITSAVSQLKENEEIWIQILLRPQVDGWQNEGHDYVTAIKTGVKPVSLNLGSLTKAVLDELSHLPDHFSEALFSPGQKHAAAIKPGPVRIEKPNLSKGQESDLETIELKLSKMGFACLIRLVAAAPTPEGAYSHLRSVTASFRQFSTANLNSFKTGKDIIDKSEFLENYRRRSLPEKEMYVLNTEELASIFHLPSISVETPLIAWSPAKRGEPPLDLPMTDCTYIGRTTFRDAMSRFGIKRDDRTTHYYAVGKTGSGKTTLFKNLIVQDILNGEGVGVIDPHGDLIDEILEYIPDYRKNDVVIFDPSDLHHPVSVNVLECTDVSQKNLLASGLVSAFRKHFENSWGPRLEYLLNNAVLTLLEVPQTTMLGITRVLMDKNYQKYIVHKIKDPLLIDFWEKEFKAMMQNTSFHQEAIAPIQNKIGRFLASSTMRNILGQARSSVRLDEIMNTKKILLVNLSKGKIGQDDANLLGSLLISRLNFMAMQRVYIPAKERQDFYLYVDEFQNFASGSFSSILSEARKYRLCLHLTHQYTAQLPDEVREAVFGNVGTMIAFGLGAPDAKILAPEFAPEFEENDLISLERHHIYVKLMINGVTSRPFSAVTDPPPAETYGLKTEIIDLSRRKYGTDKVLVEDRIKRWTEKQFDLGAAIADDARVPSSTVPHVPVIPASKSATEGLQTAESETEVISDKDKIKATISETISSKIEPPPGSSVNPVHPHFEPKKELPDFITESEKDQKDSNEIEVPIPHPPARSTFNPLKSVPTVSQTSFTKNIPLVPKSEGELIDNKSIPYNKYPHSKNEVIIGSDEKSEGGE